MAWEVLNLRQCQSPVIAVERNIKVDTWQQIALDKLPSCFTNGEHGMELLGASKKVMNVICSYLPSGVEPEVNPKILLD